MAKQQKEQQQKEWSKKREEMKQEKTQLPLSKKESHKEEFNRPNKPGARPIQPQQQKEKKWDEKSHKESPEIPFRHEKKKFSK